MTVEAFRESQPDVLPALHSREDTRNFYNRISGVYDLLAERSERSIRHAGIDKLAPKPGESLLEIGIGTGHTLEEMANAVGASGIVHGVDLAEKMVQATAAHLEQNHLVDRVDLVCGDAQKLPYEANTMDGIIMIFTLELFGIEDIPSVLAECKRVLRHGGRIVVVGMSKEGKQGVAVHTFEWFHRHFPNLMDCRPIFVRRALEAANLQVRDAMIDDWWVPVEIVLATKP